MNSNLQQTNIPRDSNLTGSKNKFLEFVKTLASKFSSGINVIISTGMLLRNKQYSPVPLITKSPFLDGYDITLPLESRLIPLYSTSFIKVESEGILNSYCSMCWGF